MQARDFDGPIRNSHALCRRRCSPAPTAATTQPASQVAAPRPHTATIRCCDGRAPLRTGIGDNGTRQIAM
jgi:hypothetical protein